MKQLFTLTAGILLLSSACAHRKDIPYAWAMIEPRSGSKVSGKVAFWEAPDGSVKVQLRINGAPTGIHGFHVHEVGDCSAPDATSAGPHFNPNGAPHSGPSMMPHHAGDFGNVTAGGNGEIMTEFTTRSITLDEGPESVVGRAVVLHADADDLTSQPAGNAGKRIGCGVVTMAGRMQ